MKVWNWLMIEKYRLKLVKVAKNFTMLRKQIHNNKSQCDNTS